MHKTLGLRDPAAAFPFRSSVMMPATGGRRIHGAPEGYVRRIMYRDQVSWWRRRARRLEIAVAEMPELPARDEIAGVEARLALRDALLALPPGKRVMLVLRYLRTCPRRRWPTSWVVLSALCAARHTRRSPS
jgi:hypothetical protein